MTSKGFFKKFMGKKAKQQSNAPYPASVTQLCEEDIESDIEDDVDADAILEMADAKVNMHGRMSVSAEAYGEWNKREDFKPPVYERTKEQAARIEQALSSSFLFSSLDPEFLQTLIFAFEEQTAAKGDIIINQGDDGDKLYLIESGEVEVTKLENETEHKFLTKLSPGDIFGELALMYNAPRAATVTALEDVTLWALDRGTFNNVVRDASIRKRDAYDAILKEVHLLRDMDNYERSKISDAIKSNNFTKGSVIITEGEPGETFYMLVKGTAEATKDGKVIKNYQKGDYFGELALLKNQPRAATVTATTDCETISLNRRSFKRLLGPVECILIRNTENYKTVLEQLEAN